MAAPTPYDRATSFRLFSAQNPSQQQSGTSLDQEFDAIKVAMDETQGNLALIQNADGRLANASVGRVQLDSSITIGFESPTPWETATEYTTVSTVFHEAIFYTCLVAHTSGTFATDLAAGKWLLVADLSVAAALADGSVTEAKLADSAVTANKIQTGAVTNSKLATNAVTAAKIQDDSVITAKILDANVTTAKIADLNVTTGKLNDSAVTTAKIADVNVTTGKIADDAVTYAKIQNMTSSRLLGRTTASSGDIEEISVVAPLSFSGGQLGSTAGIVKISTQTASASADVRFTSGIDSTYRAYRFEVEVLVPATDNVSVSMQVSTDGGSTWKTTSYLSGIWSVTSGGASGAATSTTGVILSGLMSNQATLGGLSGFLTLVNPSNASNKNIFGQTIATRQAGAIEINAVGGQWTGSQAAVDAVRFIASSGNLASGKVTMFGVL
jgi:hypothetical protein